MPKTPRCEKNDNSRVSTSGLATLRVMTTMAGHVVTGMSNADLANMLRMTPSAVNRAVNTLIYAGLAHKLDTGRFTLTVQFSTFARAADQQIATARARLNEMEHNIQTATRDLL